MFEDDKYREADQPRRDWEVIRLEVDEQPVTTVRGWSVLAWLFIIALVTAMVFMRETKAAKEELPPPLDDSPTTTQGISELQMRILIGMGEFIREFQPGKEDEIRQLYEGPDNDAGAQRQHQALWSHGTFGQRLQFAITAGEMVGPKTALESLGKLKWDWEQLKLKPSVEQMIVFNNLRKAYGDYRDKKYDAPSLKEPDRQILLSRLGWYGRLALTPPQAPDKVARNAVMARPLNMVYGMMALVLGMIVLGLAGIAGLGGLGLGALTGMLKFGLRPGTPASGVYAETFAIWMIVFMSGFLIVELWPRQQDRFTLNLIVMFGSLLVLLWPVLRGIPWSQVRADLGLSWGRLGLLEPLCGIPGYVLMLPLLGIGLSLTLILITLTGAAPGNAVPESPFEPQHFISHPIVDVVLRGSFWLRVQLVILACIAAPIVEEIMFRGVLYRQLRDATRNWGWALSGLFSALWMSFIFAVIHPQGLLAVPALMGIAMGCTLVREWRDSLWASIVVHAMNNGLVFTVLMLGAA